MLFHVSHYLLGSGGKAIHFFLTHATCKRGVGIPIVVSDLRQVHLDIDLATINYTNASLEVGTFYVKGSVLPDCQIDTLIHSFLLEVLFDHSRKHSFALWKRHTLVLECAVNLHDVTGCGSVDSLAFHPQLGQVFMAPIGSHFAVLSGRGGGTGRGGSTFGITFGPINSSGCGSAPAIGSPKI
jgi:hypothetical protein